MWPVSDAAQRWYDAMAAQDRHEQFDCRACRVVGAPVCAEGVRLQKAARAAWEASISDQYAGMALDESWGPDSAAQLLERGPR